MKPRQLPLYSPSAVSAAIISCSAAGATAHGSAIHALVKKTAVFSGDVFISAALLRLYSAAGRPLDSTKVFDDCPCPDPVLWTSLISAHARNGNPSHALTLFSRMTSSLNPPSVTLIVVLSACAAVLRRPSPGAAVHCYALRRRRLVTLPFANALLHAYTKTHALTAAHNLFKTMLSHDVISYTTMISCYALNGSTRQAMDLFYHMLHHGPEVNAVTVVSALHACAMSRDLSEGRRIHLAASQKALDRAPLVVTSLIHMYTCCGSIEEAATVFDRTALKDVTTWAAFLDGSTDSLAVFRRMLEPGTVRPDSVVVAKVVAAARVLPQVRCLHGFVARAGFEENGYVSASLVDAYSKCGQLAEAERVFEQAPERDMVLWGSMVGAYGAHGRGPEAVRTFRRMTANPNGVVYLSVLTACSRAGMVREGLELFGEMVHRGAVRVGPEHYGVVVDMLGRTGDLEAAKRVVDGMVGPAQADVLGALLGACRIHRDFGMGERVGRRVAETRPDHAGYHLLMSGMYAAGGEWARAAEVRESVRRVGLRKMVGESVVEVRGRVHGFVAGDRRHRDSARVCGMVRLLGEVIREESCGCGGPHRDSVITHG